jgi:hypothetical protein
MSYKNLLGDTNKGLSVITNPFVTDCIDDIHIRYIGKPLFDKSPYWKAYISFKNGLSSGEQQTPQCDTLPEVLEQLKIILESIKK